MSHPRSLSVVLGALVATLTLLGCGGGGGSGGSEGDAEPVTTRSEPTTTTAAPTIDLSRPIPGGSLHGIPRPPLENTGDDYVAIIESLIANFRWLTENPDPAVITELYVPGTEDHESWVPAFEELADKQWRASDDDYYLIAVDVVDVQPGLVSLRVTDHLGEERILDAVGERVGGGRQREPAEQTATVLISADSSGRWRIADWSVVGDSEVEV